MYADVPETIAEAQAAPSSTPLDRKVANFVEFIGEGRGSSSALAASLSRRRSATQRVYGHEIDRIRVESQEAGLFQAPPPVWIE